MTAQKTKSSLEPSSFRDPSGFVFYQNNRVFRQVNNSYKTELDTLFTSGLFEKLVTKKYLLQHTKVSSQAGIRIPVGKNTAYALFEAQKIPFISYPYEWSFSQLKDAALLTLQIQKLALEYDMSLKDASSYNIQFFEGKPIFIDLLSFEHYEAGKPWVAYRQFCQHFLGPLLLMSMVDVGLGKLLQTYIDGIPLGLVSKLLPKKSYLSFGIVSHIHLHAQNQEKYASSAKVSNNTSLSLNKVALLGIIDSLESLIKKTKYESRSTEWGEYYTFTNYSDTAFKKKRQLVKQFLNLIHPKIVWDIGANTGEFSRVASESGIFTVASDYDHLAVEKNYLRAQKNKEQNILPLVIDLTNPSPAIGWASSERKSFMERGPADLVLALALIHHLAISNNLPFSYIANFCSKIGTAVIIEFVPKSDSQVQKLLQTRKDIFVKYTQEDFEKEFSKKFKIVKKSVISGSKRTLYLMKSI